MLTSLSKNSPLPYHTNKPLSKDTKWIAIPMYISSTEVDFKSALQTIQKVLNEIKTVSNVAKNKSCSTFLMDFNTNLETLIQTSISIEKEEFEKLNTDIQFLENHTSIGKNNYCIETITYLILSLEDTLFWNNMQHISSTLDTLYHFALSYKKDKLTSVVVGKD